MIHEISRTLITCHDGFLIKNVALQIQVLVLGSLVPGSRPLLRFKVRALSSEDSQALTVPQSLAVPCDADWCPSTLWDALIPR